MVGTAGWAGRSSLSTSYGSDGWRIWVSFLLGGLYGPIAGRWLLARAEYTASTPGSSLPPPPPSQRGSVVLGLVVGVPLVLSFVGTFSAALSRFDSMLSYRALAAADARGGSGLSGTFLLGPVVLSLLVALLFATAALRARWIESRYDALLEHATSGDPQQLLRFRGAAARRHVATVIAMLPLALLLLLSAAIATGLLLGPVITVAYFFPLAAVAAAWAVSWLTISPTIRYEQAVSSSP